MKIVFHPDFLPSYIYDPAASAGRLDYALRELQQRYPVVIPEPCLEEDVLRVHSLNHINYVKSYHELYPIALLAAGSSIQAAQIALQGEFSFALCRPPGHHASPTSCWGFCYFNNIAIAVQSLIHNKFIENALIIDFDLHFGDGTSNFYSLIPQVDYYFIRGTSPPAFIKNLTTFLEGKKTDIIAVSAGFDRHHNDWGRCLKNEDYYHIGELLGAFAQKHARGRLFSILEGGYNPQALGEGIISFLGGLESSIKLEQTGK